MSVLNRQHFYDEKAAFEHVESILWPDGPVCPKCGNCDKHYKLEGVRSKPSKKHPKGADRHSLYKCAACRTQFTVRIGTLFEESRLPLHIWLQAIHLMCSSKKGISANQLSRVLEITLKSAWFLAHRIREAMRGDDFVDFGTDGGVVEVDETFIGNNLSVKPKHTKKGRGYAHKHKLLSLVDRESGRAKSIIVDDLKATTLLPILIENISTEAVVYTDEAGQYKTLGDIFQAHDFVRHGTGEYGRGDIHTNTIEGYFSIFKRGMKGVYQHCAKKHLHRYAAEFEFRYNHRVANGPDDNERASITLKGAVGKRLTYERSGAAG